MKFIYYIPYIYKQLGRFTKNKLIYIIISNWNSENENIKEENIYELEEYYNINSLDVRISSQ